MPKDGAAADQAVGEVMAHQTFDRYGHESGSPEMDTETRVQALRGAATARPPQCTHVRWGYLECHLMKVAFSLVFKALGIRGGQDWCQPPR